MPSVRRYTTLFSQGHEAHSLFVIEDGLIKLTRTNDDGNRIILAMCGSGDIVGEEVLGNADLELHSGGVTWRFDNVGNREAFAARPDIYMPRFGGYDPVGVARGVAVAGKPNVWLIEKQQLFLFYDRTWLENFAADPDRLIAEAERKWPAVQSTLSP